MLLQSLLHRLLLLLLMHCLLSLLLLLDLLLELLDLLLQQVLPLLQLELHLLLPLCRLVDVLVEMLLVRHVRRRLLELWDGDEGELACGTPIPRWMTTNPQAVGLSESGDTRPHTSRQTPKALDPPTPPFHL